MCILEGNNLHNCVEIIWSGFVFKTNTLHDERNTISDPISYQPNKQSYAFDHQTAAFWFTFWIAMAIHLVYLVSLSIFLKIVQYGDN